MSALSGDNDVKLIDAIQRRREAASLSLIGSANVRDHSIEHDVGMLCHRTEVLRQSDVKRYLLTC